MDTTQIGRVTDRFREYYVIFHNAEELPWYAKMWTRKGFEHCSILTASKKGCIQVTQTVYNVEIINYDCCVNELADAFSEQPNHTVVYFPMIQDYEPLSIRLSMFLPTCVALCQRIIGLEFKSVTPFGFYKELINGRHLQQTKDTGAEQGATRPPAPTSGADKASE